MAARTPKRRAPRASRRRAGELMELTIALALGAGLLSFLSPCVLPLVPAYVGQLSAVAVVGRADGTASRWLAVRHSLAYVVGFGAVFTVLGITATYAAGPAVRLPADPAPDRRRAAHRARAESRGRAAHPRPRSHVAAARGRRGRLRRERDGHDGARGARDGAADGSRHGSAIRRSTRRPDRRARAAAGSPRSGSARSSRSAGRRASA